MRGPESSIFDRVPIPEPNVTIGFDANFDFGVNWNWVMSSWTSMFLTFWCVMTIFGGIRGAAGGFCEWFDWIEKRNRLILPVKMVVPILNVSRDVGFFAYCVITSALMSAIVVATYPISVPIMMRYAKEEESTSGDGDDNRRKSVGSASPVSRRSRS